MKHTLLKPAIAALAVTLSAGSAFAQDHHRTQGEHARPADRGRAEAPRSAPAPAPRVENRSEGRAVERAVPRAEYRGDYRGDYRRDGRYDRPAVVAPRVVAPAYRSYGYGARPYVARPYVVRPYYNRPYVVRPYYTPAYVYRPHFSIGIGFGIGYPVPYPYAYPYPVPVYGYSAPSGPVVVGPTSNQYGGVSLEVSPEDGDVYVDGGYAGHVQDFDGTQQTLTLRTGRHHIEISAQGYQTMAFDVDVVPGQIVPCRGDLQRY